MAGSQRPTRTTTFNPPLFRGVLRRSRSPSSTLSVGTDSSSAAGLAERLMSASTQDDRRSALLAIFSQIGVGVYASADGKPLVRGREASDFDLYAYDFEIDQLAATLDGSGNEHPITDLSQRHLLRGNSLMSKIEIRLSASLQSVASAVSSGPLDTMRR